MILEGIFCAPIPGPLQPLYMERLPTQHGDGERKTKQKKKNQTKKNPQKNKHSVQDIGVRE